MVAENAMNEEGPDCFTGLREDDIEGLTRIGRDAGFLLGGSGFGRFLGLCFNFIIARFGGDALFGLYTLSLTIINYILTMATFGLDQALVRFVSIYRGMKDPSRIKGALVQGFLINLGLGSAGAAALFVLAPWMSAGIFKKPELAVYLRWMAPSIPFLCLLNFFLGATQGYRKMKYTPLVRDLAHPLFKLVLIATLFSLGFRLYAVLTTHLASSVIWGLASLLILVRIFSPVLEKRKALFESKMIRFSVPLFLNDFVMKSFRWSDVIFLGFFRGSGEIGVYRIAQITSEISRIVFRSFKTTFAPVISDLHHRGETRALKNQFMIISKWAFSVSFPPLIFFTILARETLGIFGQKFVAGALCLVILNVGRMVSVSTGLVANMIVMSGHSRLTLFNSIFGNFLNFVLNALLIKRYGILGAAWAYAISISLLNVTQMLQVRWIFGFFPYYSGYLKPLGASLVAGLAVKYAYGLFAWPATVGVVVCAVIFLVVYILALLAFGLPPEDRLLLRQFKERIR